MPDGSRPLDRTFDNTIGVDVKGEVWACVEIPDSTAVLGTGKATRVDATVDGLRLPNIGLMPTGAGGLMLSLNAKVRKRLGKDIGDVVTVRLQGPSA